MYLNRHVHIIINAVRINSCVELCVRCFKSLPFTWTGVSWFAWSARTSAKRYEERGWKKKKRWHQWPLGSWLGKSYLLSGCTTCAGRISPFLTLISLLLYHSSSSILLFPISSFVSILLLRRLTFHFAPELKLPSLQKKKKKKKNIKIKYNQNT